VGAGSWSACAALRSFLSIDRRAWSSELIVIVPGMFLFSARVTRFRSSMSSGLGWTPETDTCRIIGSELCRILIAVRRHHSAKISLAGQHLHDRSQEDDAHVALALIDPTNFITWTWVNVVGEPPSRMTTSFTSPVLVTVGMLSRTTIC